MDFSSPIQDLPWVLFCMQLESFLLLPVPWNLYLDVTVRPVVLRPFSDCSFFPFLSHQVLQQFHIPSHSPAYHQVIPSLLQCPTNIPLCSWHFFPIWPVVLLLDPAFISLYSMTTFGNRWKLCVYCQLSMYISLMFSSFLTQRIESDIGLMFLTF